MAENSIGFYCKKCGFTYRFGFNSPTFPLYYETIYKLCTGGRYHCRCSDPDARQLEMWLGHKHEQVGPPDKEEE